MFTIQVKEPKKPDFQASDLSLFHGESVVAVRSRTIRIPDVGTSYAHDAILADG